MYYLKKECSLYSILMYLEFLSIIYQSGTVASALKTNPIIFNITRCLMILIGFLFLVLGLKKTTMRVRNGFVFLFVIMELLAILNFVIYPHSAIELQYKIILFLIFYCISIFFTRIKKSIYDVIYNIIIFIAAITLLFYIAISFLKIPVPYTIIDAPGTSAVYYRNYLNLFYSYSNGVVPRISGIFWEPGVYQIYLNLGILLYILNGKKNKWQLLLLIISVLLAQSATGYMVMALLLGYLIIYSRWVKKHYKILVKVIVAIPIVLIVACVIYRKKVTTNKVGDSFYLRMLDIKIALSIFIENPLFGVGFYNTDVFVKMNEFSRGNSNGYLTWLYTTGIVGQVFVLFPFVFRFIKEKSWNERDCVILKFAFIFLINNAEPFYALPLNVFFIAQEYYLCFAPKKENLNLCERKVRVNKNVI